MEPTTRVCPVCGEGAGGEPRCRACGRPFDNRILPTRSQWEAEGRHRIAELRKARRRTRIRSYAIATSETRGTLLWRPLRAAAVVTLAFLALYWMWADQGPLEASKLGPELLTAIEGAGGLPEEERGRLRISCPAWEPIGEGRVEWQCRLATQTTGAERAHAGPWRYLDATYRVISHGDCWGAVLLDNDADAPNHLGPCPELAED